MSGVHLRRTLCLLTLTSAATLVACSAPTTTPGGERKELLVVVSVPSSTWISSFTERGTVLAAEELKDQAAKAGYLLRVDTVSNDGSAQKAVSIARDAVSRHALALITDGTGAKAVAAVTDPASLPVFVVFDGDESIADARARPTIFRIAPANKPMATRLADYIASSKPRVAIIADSSSFGRGGAESLTIAFARDHIPVSARVDVDPTGTNVAGAVGSARRSGASALAVWGSSPVTAAVIRAARSSGWNVQIYASPTAEDPIVRQLLDDHPTWLDGTKFVSFRITAEVGPKPFAAFRAAYEKRWGKEAVGVRADGRAVTMPPDWAMYGYDAVHLVFMAFDNADRQLGAALMTALESTVITGANGDERGFGPTQREGVSPDDMYFGVFRDKRFSAVTDDILSTNLPYVDQG